MTWKNRLMAAGMTAMLALPAAAMAQPMGHMHRHLGYLGFLHGVELTDAQKTQVHQIMHQSWTQMKQETGQLRTLHEQLESQLASTAALTPGALDATRQQQDALIAQLDGERLATAMQVRALLTPAQLGQAASVHQQLETLHAQMRTLMHADHAAE